MTESTPVPADFDGSALDDWIAGGSVAKRSVVVYGRPDLFAEYEQIERDLELLGDDDELGGGERARLIKRRSDLYDEWIASKSTWIIAALTPDQIDACKTREPALVEPAEPVAPELAKNATDAQKRSHTVKTQEYDAALAAYEKARTEFNRELDLRCLAAAVERIDFADGRVAGAVTVDQLKAMRERMGDLQLTRLVMTATMATMEEPLIPAPFSHSNSETGPTS